jgi:NAD(P)-dependent dehydrogenase (short-subunit alcohol dehydrogenase family)
MSFSTFNIQYKTAVVLGGTSGLALGLADAGANAVVSARRMELVDAVALQIEAKGRKTLRMVSDVGSRDSLLQLRAAVLLAFGQVDTLVNAAGITRKLLTLEVTEDGCEEILDTNLTGSLRGCQVFGEALLKARRTGKRDSPRCRT